jgi:modification methylase
VIRADGKLQVNERSGSIHGLGAQLKGTPSCNGWMHWQYCDDAGDLHPLDDLRQAYRAEFFESG